MDMSGGGVVSQEVGDFGHVTRTTFDNGRERVVDETPRRVQEVMEQSRTCVNPYHPAEEHPAQPDCYTVRPDPAFLPESTR